MYSKRYQFKTIIVSIFGGLLLVSCTNDDIKNCLRTAGDDATKTVPLEQFKKLDIQSRHMVYFIQDTCSYAVLKGKSQLIDHINLSVNNETLSISDDNKCRFMKGYHTTDIYLHFDSLEAINFNGNAELYSQDTLHFQKIVIESESDMAKVNLTVNADDLTFKIHAVLGKMTIKGQANRAYFYCSGSNHLLFKDLICKEANILHASYGKIYTTVTEKLKATINNSGSIYCYGSPAVKDCIVGAKGTGHFFFYD